MKYIALFLLMVTAALNYQLWLGKGGWDDVHRLRAQVKEQEQYNNEQKMKLNSLRKEVEDLESGGEALIEVARYEFGYVRDDEVFYRIQ
ncbi:MAG: septum formation initiator family protein [Neisseriaceae bacterium]|nr:septum formation initiator family protein [Neisseriaceae bacterium]